MKKRCIYCGDPNCDLSCRPLGKFEELMILLFSIGLLSIVVYVSFLFLK